jgi:hypothetical protein
MTTIHPARRGQQYKRALLALVAVGVVAVVVGAEVDQHLAGPVVYAVAAVGAVRVCLYAQFSDGMSFLDERDLRLHQRASHTVVSLASYVGMPSIVALFLLDATGRLEIPPAGEGAIWAFSVFYLAWGGVYLAYRHRS